MSTRVPNRGLVAESTGGEALPVGAPEKGNVQDGTWRPDLPFNTSHGLKVTMRRAMGVTAPKRLLVPFRFQVPPVGDFRRPYRFAYSTSSTISAGQRSRPAGPELMEFSIDTLLLDQQAADASTGVVVWDGPADPEKMLLELRYIAGLVGDPERNKPTPFRLVINQPAIWRKPLFNGIAVLTAVEPTLKAGDIGTEAVSVTFREQPGQEIEETKRKVTPKPPKRPKLKDGDTLYKLAKKYLHQASAWRRIAQANGITGVDPDSAEELAAWAKKHNKTTLKIPRVELVAVVRPGKALAS